MKQWKSPPPTSDENVEEIRRKMIAGIIRHNSPARWRTINLLYSRRHPADTLEEHFEDLLDEGYIKEVSDNKYEITDRFK